MNAAERSQPFLIQCDKESAPGKAICHFVRFETVIFDNNAEFQNLGFNGIDETLDRRAAVLAAVYRIFFRDHPERLKGKNEKT